MTDEQLRIILAMTPYNRIKYIASVGRIEGEAARLALVAELGKQRRVVKQ